MILIVTPRCLFVFDFFGVELINIEFSLIAANTHSGRVDNGKNEFVFFLEVFFSARFAEKGVISFKYTFFANEVGGFSA